MSDTANVQEFMDPEQSRLKLIRLSDVTAQRIRWFWTPRIPLGKATLLQSKGGEGKSSMAIDLGARATSGRPMPITGETHKPSNVLLFSIEDDPADTHLPRLLAAEGDPSRFYVSKATQHFDENGEPLTGVLSLAHTEEIRAAVQEIKPLLLIIDPVTSFLGGHIDMHRANEIRPLLEALGDIAQEAGLALILIHHVNKGGVGGALYRGLGSVDFANIARSVLVTGEHNNRRLLAQAKMNVTRKAPSIYYKIADSFTIHGGEPVGRIIWEEETSLSADEIDTGATNKPGPAPAVDQLDIENFMLELLETPQTSKSLQTTITRDLGAGKNAFERARANLKAAGRIDYRKVGYGSSANVYWHRADITNDEWESFSRTHLENS